MNYENLFSGQPSFLELAKHYYNKNFGTMTKTEFEFLMFTILYKELEKNSGDISDVALGFELGISPKKVNAMKEKITLRTPTQDLDGINWHEKMSTLLKKRAISYDKDNEMFSIAINDWFVFYKATEFLKSNDIFYEEKNNTSIILPLSAFTALAYECCEDIEKKSSFQKAIASSMPSFNINEMINGQTFYSGLKNLGKELLITACKKVLTNGCAEAVENLVKLTDKKVKENITNKKNRNA